MNNSEDNNLNLQIEGIEGHRAQLTVEIPVPRLEKAKKSAARRISRQINIRGFRKGRAPYRRVAQTVGEAAILEEAVEDLSQKLYRESLEASGLALGAPGSMDDFNLEPAPTFVFTVPLAPVVDLKDYLDIRIGYDEPEIGDETLDEGLVRLRMQHIEVLDEDVKVTARGHRVNVRIESEFVDGEDRVDGGEADAAEADDPQAPIAPMKGDAFVNEDNATFILDPDDDPFFTGFVENLLDCERGSDVVFELTIPDDDAETTAIGRRVQFIVEIKKIEAVRIPALDDDFAALIGEVRRRDIPDVAALRRFVRSELETASTDISRREYNDEVVDRMVAGAEMKVAEYAVQESIDGLLRELENRFKNQGFTVSAFLQASGQSEDEFREQHRAEAVDRLTRQLAVSQFVLDEDIEVSDQIVANRMRSLSGELGFDESMLEQLDTPTMRENLRLQIMNRIVSARLFALGTGGDRDAAEAEVVADILAEPRIAPAAEPKPDTDPPQIQETEPIVPTPLADAVLADIEEINARAEEDDI